MWRAQSTGMARILCLPARLRQEQGFPKMLAGDYFAQVMSKSKLSFFLSFFSGEMEKRTAE